MELGRRISVERDGEARLPVDVVHDGAHGRNHSLQEHVLGVRAPRTGAQAHPVSRRVREARECGSPSCGQEFAVGPERAVGAVEPLLWGARDRDGPLDERRHARVGRAGFALLLVGQQAGA